MSTDDLFSALETAAIDTYNASQPGVDVKEQHRFAETYAKLFLEIRGRGEEGRGHYIRWLSAEHPAVRLAAALALKSTDTQMAVPVLEELSAGRYGGDVGLTAITELRMMRRHGVIE